MSTTPLRRAPPSANLQKTPSATALRKTASGTITPRASRTAASIAETAGVQVAVPSSATSSHNTSTVSTGSNNSPTGNSSNLTVAVRVRAFHEEEEKTLAIRMKDTTCEIHVPNRGRFPFSFDKCFWSNNVEDPDKEYAGQEDVFESIGKPLVDNALAGFNSSIIAYGQTGSGKTYSIFGPANSLGTKDEGLIPRVCNDIFKRLSKPTPGVQHKVFVSVIEVYLEDVYDLLQKRKELKVRGDTTNGFSVIGLKQVQVHSYDEVLKQISTADSLKTYAATAIHDRSSRAHTLFQLEVRTITDKTTRTATVLLADLAGCERVKAAQTETGLGFEQAKNINLSLLNLGTCIEAVVTRCRDGRSVQTIGEFRNSTLTKLLKDFIGGNSRTAMLVTVAPGMSEHNHSIQALRFADRAKQIQCHAVINSQVNTDAAKMKEEIAKIYNKRRELLDKECDLEMQQTMLRKKQADLEKMSFDLLEEKKQLKGDDTARAKREAEIEAKLKHLQKELNEAQFQKESLDERYLEMVEEQASLQADKEHITQEHARLMEEMEVLKEKHQIAIGELVEEKEAAVQKLDAKIRSIEDAAKDAQECAEAKLKAVSIDHERNFKEQSLKHAKAIEAVEAEEKTTRTKLISREEELALKERALLDKTEQCEVLAKAHQLGRQRVDSLEVDLEDYKTQLSQKEAAFRALEEELELSEQHSQKTIANLEGEIEGLKQTYGSSLEALNAEKDAEAKALTTANKELSQELDTMTSMLQKVELEATKEKETSDDEIKTLKAQLAATKEKLETTTKANEVAYGKIQELQNQNMALEESLQVEECAHGKTKVKLNSAIASVDEAEAQLKTTSAQLHEELQAEQKKVQGYRKRFYSSKNERDMIHQQCIAAHRALGLALQTEFQYSDEINGGQENATPGSIVKQSPVRSTRYADPASVTPISMCGSPSTQLLVTSPTPLKDTSRSNSLANVQLQYDSPPAASSPLK